MNHIQVGRLALRHEGNDWNAYYAQQHTMADAVKIGSIDIGVATAFPKRKDEFLTLMRNVVSDIIESQIGVRPLWDAPQTAPENERTGHG